MADWTDIPDEILDPQDPVLATTMLEIRDNIIASTWHPYDDSTGLLYDGSIDGAASVVETPDLDTGFEYRLYFDGVYNSTDTQALSLELMGDIDQVFVAASSADNIGTTNLNGALHGVVDFDAPERLGALFFVRPKTVRVGAGASVVTANGMFTHSRDLTETPQNVLKARIVITGTGGITEGQIILLRRRIGF